MWAPSWTWMLFANLLLGISQGLTWSTTVIMKIDLVGARRRGLAMGFNECAGYLALAASALATSWMAAAYGLRPQPFYLGIAFVAVGFTLSAFVVRDTTHHVSHESALVGTLPPAGIPSPHEVFWRTTLSIGVSRASVSRARQQSERRHGVGLFPLVCGCEHEPATDRMARGHLPGNVDVAQLVTGALSDRMGRKWLIVGGMWTQAVGIAVITMIGRSAVSRLAQCCSASERRWCITLLRPSETSPIRHGAAPPSACTGSGAISGTPGAVLAGITADTFSSPRWVVAGLTFSPASSRPCG